MEITVMMFSGLFFLGFFVCLFAHLASYLSPSFSEYFPVYELHWAIIALAFASGVHKKARSNRMCVVGTGVMGRKQGTKKAGYKNFDYFKAMPLGPRYMLKALSFYAVLNFMFCMSVGGHTGWPERAGSTYVVKEEGAPDHVVSKQDYELEQQSTLRGFSGIYMMLFLVPAFYLLYRRPRRIS